MSWWLVGEVLCGRAYRVPSKAVPGGVEENGEDGYIITSSASGVGAITRTDLRPQKGVSEAKVDEAASDLHRAGSHR